MTELSHVVITGLGVLAPNGLGKDRFWESLERGVSGIRRISRFDPSEFPVQVGGEITGFQASEFLDYKKARRLDRSTQLAIAAAKMAIEDSRLDLTKEDRREVGVMAGTAIGGQEWDFEQYDIFKTKGLDRANPFTAINTFPNACSSHVSIEFQVTGPSDTISSGCSSGAAAIGYAYDCLRYGRAQTIIVVGTDAPLNPPVFGAFCIARVLSRNSGSTNIPKPFDKHRDGIVIAEGAGALILENLDHALRRQAHIYAEVLGWASSCDAYHMMNSEPNGEQLALAIQKALKMAGLESHEVDYVKAHGDGSISHDNSETKAIKASLGEQSRKIPVSSIKSMIGHTQGASGVIEVVGCALAIEKSTVPPTINYSEADPECDLDYVPNHARPQKIDVAICNTLGFGGKNVVILLGKHNGGRHW